MNFDFDAQQYEFRESFARFLAEKFPLERHEASAGAGNSAFDSAWQGLAELGLFALLVPGSEGGLGLGLIDLALIVEELGRVLAPISVTDTLIAIDLIVRFGNETQRHLLPRIAAGESRVAIATLEADAGYHFLDADTRLTRDGDAYRLSGKKILVPHCASSSVILTAAHCEETGTTEILLLAREASGISWRPHSSLDPSCAMAELSFESVPVTPAQILAGAATRLFDVSAVVAAGLQIGLAGKALDLAVEYARTRVQFGKPVGSFQAIKHRCADMAVRHDGGRSAAYYGFWAVAEDAPDRARAASVAKAFCGDAARMICHESIQVHGGMGFTWELGLHHYLRRAKILEFACGDIAFHRERALTATLAGLGD